MTIKVNKQMLDNLYLTHTNTIKPIKQDLKLIGYQDAVTGEEVEMDRRYVLFVPASFVNMVDKISQKIWDFSVLNNTVEIEKLIKIYTTLICGDSIQKQKAITKLVNDGIVSEVEVQGAKAITTNIDGYDPDLAQVQHNIETGYVEYIYNVTVSLVKPYNDTINTGNEDLFLFFPTRFSQNIGGHTIGTETTSWLNRYANTSGNTGLDLTYIAVQTGDLVSPDNEDIKFNSIDKIDYIDNFRILFEIPNEFIY